MENWRDQIRQASIRLPPALDDWWDDYLAPILVGFGEALEAAQPTPAAGVVSKIIPQSPAVVLSDEEEDAIREETRQRKATPAAERPEMWLHDTVAQAKVVQQQIQETTLTGRYWCPTCKHWCGLQQSRVYQCVCSTVAIPEANLPPPNREALWEFQDSRMPLQQALRAIQHQISLLANRQETVSHWQEMHDFHHYKATNPPELRASPEPTGEPKETPPSLQATEPTAAIPPGSGISLTMFYLVREAQPGELQIIATATYPEPNSTLTLGNVLKDSSEGFRWTEPALSTSESPSPCGAMQLAIQEEAAAGQHATGAATSRTEP